MVRESEMSRALLTVACVEVGNYCGRGAEYVLRLKRGVERHLALPHEFVCLTDNHVPVAADGILCQKAHPSLTGWWAKLALFDPRRFSGRVLYLDLDTIVEGDLAPLFAIDTRFAMLSDLYEDQRCASGVMLWEAGAGWFVWSETIIALNSHSLSHRFGDGGFIEDAARKYGVKIDRLQQHVEGIYSYKRSRRDGIPDSRRLCCFHGKPRPHETDRWKEAA